jgi:iron complex outermembrane receptor protein
VRKSSSAEADEGSLGATVDLITGRPFDYKNSAMPPSRPRIPITRTARTHSPRLTGLFSDRFFDGKLGFLVSAAYSEKDSETDQYRRQIVTGEYVYRSATWATLENPRRAGFSAPIGTTFTNRVTNPTAANPTARCRPRPPSPIRPISTRSPARTRPPTRCSIPRWMARR